MELKSLKATARKTGTKGAAHLIRREGGIPAVLYGGGPEPVALTIGGRELERIMHTSGGSHAIMQIDFDEQPEHSSPAIVKMIQRHPLKGSVLHADFMRIRLDERIRTSVPVVFTGQAKGLSNGGLLEHQLREIEVECLALEVPNHLSVDVTNLDVGDVLHVSEIVAPEGVEIVTDADAPIVSMILPRAAVVAEPTEAAEGAAATPADAKEGSKSE